MSADITLVVGVHAFRNWLRVDWESDYTTPSDAWSAELANPSSVQLDALTLGQPVVLLVGGQIVLRGLLERRSVRRRARQGTTVTVEGRDLAAPLVDCAPGVWSWRKLSLAAAAAKALAELGNPATVSAAAEALELVPHLKAEVGETYWAILERYARRAGIGLHMTSAGALTLGRPTYTSPAVGTLVHRAGAGSNVLSAELSEDLAGRFSRVTVLGQAAGSDNWAGADPCTLRGEALDAEIVALGLTRPTVLEEGALASTAAARKRAEWEVSQRRFEGRRLIYEVPGLGPSADALWTPNTSVVVDDAVFGVTGVRWLAGVRYQLGREDGYRSTLDLREPYLLLPEPT